MGEQEAKTYSQADAQELSRVAKTFAVGSIIEKRGDHLRTRQV